MPSDLLIKRDLTIAYLASILVAIVMAIASIAGLIWGSTIYPMTDVKLFPLFVGQDALNLIVGLPLLLGSMWLARRGSLIGLLLWPGALFYVAYDYGYYVLGAPINWFFLAYIGLMTVSIYAAIAVVVSIDADKVRERFSRNVPRRAVGGFLAGLAVLFTTLWTALNVSAMASGTPLDDVARVVTIMDLTLQLPALFVGGILLWRGSSIAHVVAPGLLLQAAAYLAGLSAITVLQEILIGLPLEPVAVIPGFVVAGMCLVFIGAFVRGAAASSALRHTTRRSPATT